MLVVVEVYDIKKHKGARLLTFDISSLVKGLQKEGFQVFIKQEDLLNYLGEQFHITNKRGNVGCDGLY